MALTLLVIAPLSVVVAHSVGTKFVVASGLALIAVGLGLLSRTTLAGTYRDCIGPFVVLGVGVALALAPCTESVMGPSPAKKPESVGHQRHRHADGWSPRSWRAGHSAQPPLPTPAGTSHYPRRRLRVGRDAHREFARGGAGGGPTRSRQGGRALAVVARHAFVSGMDLALVIATVVVALAALLVLVLLPNQGSRFVYDE